MSTDVSPASTVEASLFSQLPDEEDFSSRRVIQKRVSGLSREEIEEHPNLSAHQPDWFGFDLLAKRSGGAGYLYRARRKTVGAMIQWLKSHKKELGHWYRESPEPHPTCHLPLAAPIPPATSASVQIKEGGSEGYFVRMVLLDRRQSKDGPQAYRTPRAWDVWTTKYHASDRAEAIAEALNDDIGDLGSAKKAQTDWQDWHEEGRWETSAAETLRRIGDLASTKAVRKEGSAWEWPRSTRQEAAKAARQVGWTVARQILDLSDPFQWPAYSRIPGR